MSVIRSLIAAKVQALRKLFDTPSGAVITPQTSQARPANNLAVAIKLDDKWPKISAEISTLLSGGDFDEAKETTIHSLLDSGNLKNGYRRYVDRQIRRKKLRLAIAKGDLPKLDVPSLLMEAGEIIHWYGPVIHVARSQKGRAGQNEPTDGNLAITDNRLVFLSSTDSFDISLNRIMTVEAHTHNVGRNINTIEITVVGGRAIQFTMLWPAEIPAEIMNTAIGKVKQTILPTARDRTRSISREVRQRVWQRDGGKCVECSATEYLEFDHIIPVAKGGSNTEANVQLLCRKCNAKKSARI